MVKRSEKCSVPTRASVLLCPYPLTPGPRLLPAQHCPSRCPVRGVRLLSFHCRTHPLPSRLCTELRRHCVALHLRWSRAGPPRFLDPRQLPNHCERSHAVPAVRSPGGFGRADPLCSRRGHPCVAESCPTPAASTSFSGKLQWQLAFGPRSRSSSMSRVLTSAPTRG